MYSNMRLDRPIFLALLALSLATYAVDCGATMTPDQAMQCCNSMDCSSHGHDSQDCCKTMRSMHAPFVQSSPEGGASFSPVLFAVMPSVGQCSNLAPSAIIIATDCHAPPIPNSAALRPLRI
jgi:hypothetical protein